MELAPITRIKVIFEKSVQRGKLPTDWCRTTYNISPVFKKGGKSLAASYEPISLACVLCKVLEHILASDTVGHLGGQGFVHDLQQGF